MGGVKNTIYIEYLKQSRIQHLIDAVCEGDDRCELIPFEITYQMLFEVVDRILEERLCGIEEEIGDNAIKKRQKKIAQNRRPKRQSENRPLVQKFWDEWQKNPSLYKDKTAFDRAMLDKTEMPRIQTIQDWRRILENGGRLVQ